MPFLRLRNLASGETLEFETPEIRIGREPDSELVLSAEGSGVVSGRHARVFERGGGWWLEDVGSRNGTFLNDRRLMPGAAEQLTTSAVVGFGERGPRFRVEAVAKRRIADTLVEGPTAIRPSAATVPMEGIDATAPPASVAQGTPSPPPPPPQELRVVLMEALTGEQHQATGGRLRIGRGKECELRPVGPDDTSVSRVHTEIVLKPDGKVVVRDAQSRNGTYLGDELLTAERELKQGDRLKLGAAGPELLVAHLTKPGERPAEEKKERRRKRLSSAAARAAEKLGAARRSFGGKGATVFFSEMFAETSRKSARRVRIVVWSSVVVLAGAAGGFYYYKDQLEQRLERQLEQQLAAQQAVADSIRNAAAAEYDRLRQELEEARAGSAPAAVVESLRVALGEAQARTTALEAALERAEASLTQQLAAGDSIGRQAQNELQRLQGELSRASTATTSSDLLDSLRSAVQAAEERATAIAAQVRTVRGGGANLAALAQANQAAVGLVTAYVGPEIYDGSGFAITPSGYFVTNRHVVMHRGRSPDSVFVTMADQQRMRRAEVVRAAPASGPDLAVLKISGHDGSRVASIDWSGSNAQQGGPAALIGFPAGLGNALDATRTVRTTMTAGIFSKVTADVINFDGFTIGGSSGSPIFNSAGDVVAIHRAGLAEATGLAFAVPVPKLVPLLPPVAKRELGLGQ